MVQVISLRSKASLGAQCWLTDMPHARLYHAPRCGSEGCSSLSHFGQNLRDGTTAINCCLL
jgi:hypothetical protein